MENNKMISSAAAGEAGLIRAFLLSSAASAALLSPAAAFAQDEATPAEQSTAPADDYADGEDFSTGNQIVVTATKREQTLQDVPVAVTVTTAETLERGQIRDIRDLQTVVPSLSVGQRQSVANTNFFIRGFGNGANNAGIEPSVGVFVDGVYRSKTAAQITDLPDVQRIEVLRGPQSTLFGKNASAGVISITTQTPAFDFGGSAELTYGNYNALVGKAHVTGPISENTAFSLAAGFNKRDGFYRDLGTGDRTNERDRWFTRGQLYFDPGTDVTVRLIADYDRIDENCCAVVNIQSGPATLALQALGGQVNAPEDRFDNVVYNNFNSTNDIENYGGSAQVDWQLGPAALTSITAYRGTHAVTDQDPDFTSADLVYPNFQDLRIGTFTQELRLTSELAQGVDLLLGAFYINERIDQDNLLRYGTQFRPYANILIQQASGGALNVGMLEQTFGLFDGTNYTGQFFAPGQGFTEQYTLKSNAVSLFGQVDFEVMDGLVLTLGGNWTKDRKKFRADVDSTDVFSGINLDAPQYAPFRQQLLLAGALQQAGVDPTDPAAIFAFATNPATAPTFAAFQAFAAGNANNPAANPLAPLRALQFLPPFQNIPNAVEDGRTSDSDFSYTARLAYDINNQFNVYASYATGFKASSINLSRDSRPTAADRLELIDRGLAVNNLRAGSRFAGPEEARVIELGVKANLGWLSANLAVFDQEIKGFQSNIFTGSGFALLNAGKQSTKGVELESQASIAGLTLNFGVTYLDPKYDSFVASAVGDLSGRRPAGIPKWTVLLGAQYELPVGNGLLVPRASYLFQSDTQLVEGLPGFVVRNPDGSIANGDAALAAAAPFRRELNDLTASLGYEMDNGLTLEVWGRNLLDDRNLETIFDSVAQPGGISGYPNDPHTYGVTARFKW
jgi:outer membrane receptor protein involved in Fe transport